jgi:NAD-specific glutamate dehydrogenase
MKRLSLKLSFAFLTILTVSGVNSLYAGFNLNFSAEKEQAFINDYAQKVSSLTQELFILFDDYTNPSKGGSHTEYTDRAQAKVAEYKKLMDSLEEKMKGCSDKNSTFYKILEKAHSIAQKRYRLLEQVCEVMESYRGSSVVSAMKLGYALKPLKEQLTSAAATAQLRTELTELKALMENAKITNAAQLQAVIDALIKQQPSDNLITQLNVLGTRLSNG